MLKSRCKTKAEARAKKRLAQKSGWQNVRIVERSDGYGVYVSGWKKPKK